eukprot:Nitzschia sp. Nitz4//scaffold7_size249615//155758//156674//NITZ4_001186-RA/size249615-augustus-gene-0.35-mRNA-1//-1//CDS//3329558469//4209//frame0
MPSSLPSTPARLQDVMQPSPSTAENTNSINTSLDMDSILKNAEGSSFEEIMKETNRIRREKEEYNIAELKVQIARLENALAAETKRRVDATTKLDDQARTLVFEMEERLRQQLQQDNLKLEERIAKVEERLQEVEQRFLQDSTAQMATVQRKATEFSQALDQWQQEQDVERKARLKREGSLLQQVENHAKEFEDRWNAERKDRDERMEKLESTLQVHQAKKSREEQSFQTRIQEELEALRTEIDLEVQERQTQDDEIVAALNRYTQQLQHSLSILSSD